MWKISIVLVMVVNVGLLCGQISASDLNEIVDAYEHGDSLEIETTYTSDGLSRRIVEEQHVSEDQHDPMYHTDSQGSPGTEDGGFNNTRSLNWQSHEVDYRAFLASITTVGAFLSVFVPFSAASPFGISLALSLVPLLSELHRDRLRRTGGVTIRAIFDGVLTQMISWIDPQSRAGTTDHRFSDSPDERADWQYQDVILPPFDPVSPSIDPHDSRIPKEAKEVYQWSYDWNPELTDAWLQCTTYVAMVYEMNGFEMQGHLVGNAADWVGLKDTFMVWDLQDTLSEGSVQPLDTLVWTDSNWGHVGIVVEVANGIITVANANAPQSIYQFRQVKSSTGSISLIPLENQGVQQRWQPSHLLRPRESLRRRRGARD